MLADVAAVNASSPPTYARGTNFDVAKRAALRAAYYDSLRVCRSQQPGRVSRRVQLSTTQFGVTQCLRRRGWTSDGTPLHEARCGALPAYGIESRGSIIA